MTSVRLPILCAALLCFPLGVSADDNPQTKTGEEVFYLFEPLEPRALREGFEDPAQAASLRSQGAVARSALSPNATYRVWAYTRRSRPSQGSGTDPGGAATARPAGDVIGFQIIQTGPSGSIIEIPPIPLRPINFAHDTDGDGVPDIAENVVGSDPSNIDSDGDGIPDGAELDNGSDPTGGTDRVGVIAAVDTPGRATDVCAVNDVVLVADRAAGVSIYNVFNGLNPRVIGRIPTPAEATRVSCAGTRVAAVTGDSLSLIDISDPPAARITRIVDPLVLGGNARSVVAVDRVAFVGLSTGKLASVQMNTGVVLERVTLGSVDVVDLAVDKGTLYALDNAKLHALSLLDPLGLKVIGSTDAPQLRANRRLFVGGGFAYGTRWNGVNVFDVSNPTAPIRVGTSGTASFGWEQFLVDGSGNGIAAIGPNSFGGRDVTIYDSRDPNQVDLFIATHATPGPARAVTTFNGLAYAADERGLQVIRYLPADGIGVPPTISLSTSFGLAQVEEGKLARVTATVSDDVQVRNVEFTIDGVKVLTDGNFPYELVFTTPRLTDAVAFRLRARASDTGGNATFTQEFLINITPDVTAPVLGNTLPADGALLSRLATLTAFVNEPLDVASLTPSTLALTEAGPDGLLGSADDVPVNGGTFSFDSTLNAALRLFEPDLPAGRYRAEVTTGVTDLAGNALTQGRTFTFEVYDSSVDTDGDGVPDALEVILGLDPTLVDSDDPPNGVPDGLEDADDDGLVNAAEVLFGGDPRSMDSDGDGILDGLEDPDGDRLVDAEEFTAGTNPFNADTDADGFSDFDEVRAGSNPLDALSLPIRFGVGATSIHNTAAPEAISGQVEGPKVSIENEAP